MKKIVNATIFNALEEWAPKDLAYEWDQVGLQIGSHQASVNKIMVTLDVVESVVDEAIENDVNLIIAHHPLFFKPLHKINIHSSKGRVIEKLIKHNISVYAAHTNLDLTENGVNDLLFHALDLQQKENLVDVHIEKLIKLVVFVPKTHINKVRNALSLAGAGHIGNYSHCTFQTAGQGTFMPLEGTDPYIGSKHQLEMVDEVKIETIVKEKDLKHVLQSMQNAHPYEEVAYDLFPLVNEGKTYGLGRIGKLQQKMSLATFCGKVKQTFNISQLRVTGDLTKDIERVALVGGSGEKFIQHALRKKADVYLTGDLTFHHAQDAAEMGLALVDAGHYIEKVMKQAVKDYLEKRFNEEEINIIVSKTNTDPFQFV